MARLLLIDTNDDLPGLLPLHGWSALMTSDLVMLGSPSHPFVGHLDAADLAYEVLGDAEASLAGADLLGADPLLRARAAQVVTRIHEVGEVAYLFGPGEDEAFTQTLAMAAAQGGVEVEVVYFGVSPKGSRLLRLVAVEARLRGPDGCPWDREQTHGTLGRHAIEEVYELLEAIESGEPDAIREELGDVLLQVVFHAQIADDAGTFDIDAVADGITDKLVHRHPHVFGDLEVADAGEVMRNWEDLKDREKPERTGPFDGVPTAQPALQLVDKYQRRAQRHGVDPHAPLGVFAKAREALAALESDGTVDMVGDLLAAAVGIARAVGVDPEEALRASAHRLRAEVEAAG